MRTLIGLVISIPMAVWVYQVAKGREKNATGWAIFTVLAWPIPAAIIGARHRRWIMAGLGVLGLSAMIMGAAFLVTLLLMMDKQPPVSRLVWELAAKEISLALLLLTSLVLVARRCSGILYGLIHGLVGLKILFLIGWPATGLYLLSRMGHAKTGLAMNSIAIGTMLVLLALPWVGFGLSNQELRRQFVRIFTVYTVATIACYLLSGVVSSIITHVFMTHTNWEQCALFRNVASILLAALPQLALLLGLIKMKAPDALPPPP